ncbi:class I SAM-dependent methyltransferase [Macrococcus hajekii]|uniref:Class I SAM-dependent methyltransferase n=1 Tax=Macrococcus hajekii TaxID=198482 RepID=A0A4R6BM22_9STAP|nr:class I SAM-dependent methyltransferase [Macrococcus hajekii]TDM02860.1 class I SAM-dependent methyltransferase [Macrococcus hajekii]GGB04459.1 methyltransferase [Macrococcus hajekii]
MTYEAFALLYDELMYDQPYDKWLALTEPYLMEASSVLDLGCGTGSFTALLPKNLERVGVDLSEEMLTVAAAKDSSIQWLTQDITELALDRTFDVITCFCDSMNYITEAEALDVLFERVAQHLTDDGIFLFDVHSIWKMENLFDGQTYSDETDRVMYIWQTEPGDAPYSVHHDMSFFVEEADGRYSRYDESHYQRTYPQDFYQNLISRHQLVVECIFADFDVNKTDLAEAERIFYVIRKKTKI